MQIFLNLNGKTILFEINPDSNISEIYKSFNINPKKNYITCESKLLSDDSDLSMMDYKTLYINSRILGGKGGFGSQLKGRKRTKKQTKNFDSCRDLQGRRLKIVNQERMIKNYNENKKQEQETIDAYNKKQKPLSAYKQMKIQEKNKKIMEKKHKYYEDHDKILYNIEKSFNILKKRRLMHKDKQILKKDKGENDKLLKKEIKKIRKTKKEKDLMDLILS